MRFGEERKERVVENREHCTFPAVMRTSLEGNGKLIFVRRKRSSVTKEKGIHTDWNYVTRRKARSHVINRL